MAAASTVAVILEKVGTKAIETAKSSIENAKKTGETVLSKLEDIKNMSPEQLRERMEEILENYKKSIEEKASQISDALEKYGEDDEKTSEGTEGDESKELSEDEINEKQRKAIKDAFERIKKGENLSTEELGNLGEMMMDQYYISQGYKPLNKHRVTSLDDKKGGFRQGIDGVYEKTNPDGTKTYVIADAKYNKSSLQMTNDGKQMSENWIDKRLDDAVGKEKADEIRDAAEENPDSVKHEVYHISPRFDGSGEVDTETQEVDSDGNKVGDKTVVEHYDANGDRVEIAPVEQNGGGSDEG